MAHLSNDDITAMILDSMDDGSERAVAYIARACGLTNPRTRRHLDRMVGAGKLERVQRSGVRVYRLRSVTN